MNRQQKHVILTVSELVNCLFFLKQVANILLAHAGRGGGRGVTEAAAEIARAAARSWFAPLLDTACDRLAFVLGNLFDLALERHQNQDSECKKPSCSPSFCDINSDVVPFSSSLYCQNDWLVFI